MCCNGLWVYAAEIETSRFMISFLFGFFSCVMLFNMFFPWTGSVVLTESGTFQPLARDFCTVLYCTVLTVSVFQETLQLFGLCQVTMWMVENCHLIDFIWRVTFYSARVKLTEACLELCLESIRLNMIGHWRAALDLRFFFFGVV